MRGTPERLRRVPNGAPAHYRFERFRFGAVFRGRRRRHSSPGGTAVAGDTTTVAAGRAVLTTVAAGTAVLTTVAAGAARRGRRPGGGTGTPPAFRGGVEIVSLNVTATDSMGRYVTDLKESEFQVFESGVKQALTVFNRRENPIALSLLLDSSASMEYKLPTLQAAATNFVQRLKPHDIAEVVDFDGSVTLRQEFTSNHADLERGIQRMSAGGSTALHNAIYTSLKRLKKVQTTSDEEARRQALIVFSDGQDTSSLVTFEDVLDLAKHSETAIYTIGLRDPHDQARGFSSSEFVLRQFSLETGGRSFFPSNISELSSVYGQIADELSSRYLAGLRLEQSEARRSVAPDCRAADAPEHHPPDEEGLLRAERIRTVASYLLLLLYGAAAVTYSVHFARRGPSVGRTATTLLLAAALVHTFSIAAQTVANSHAMVASSPGDLDVRLAADALVSLPGDHHQRARDGRLHPADRRQPAGHPDLLLGGGASRSGAAEQLVLGAHGIAALRLRQLRDCRDARPHLRAAVQGDQEEAPRLLLHEAPVAADPGRHELARGDDRPGLPDHRCGRRHRLDAAGETGVSGQLEPGEDRLADPKVFISVLTWVMYFFAVLARRTMGWAGAAGGVALGGRVRHRAAEPRR